MQTRVRTSCRIVSFVLVLVLLLGSFGIDAFAGAGCSVTNARFGYGYNTMSSFQQSSFGGGRCEYSPTLALVVKGVGKPAYCLDHGKWVGNENATYVCRTSYSGHNMNLKTKESVLGAILATSDSLGGIKCINYNGQTIVHTRGGSVSSDRWLVTQILVWALTGDNVFFQGNGKIGVTDKAKSDVVKALDCAVGKSSRPSDIKAAKDYAQKFYKALNEMYAIPSFCTYTSTHPMGKDIAGKPGANGGTGTIVLDKSCKQPDGTYKKVITDTNGVLKNFDFTGEFSPGFSGLLIEQSGNKMTITYDGSNGCWSEESGEVKRKVPGSSNSVALWQHVSGDSGAQFLATYSPAGGELGCKLKVEIKDCTITSETPGEWTTTPSATTTPGDTPDIPTDTPETSTPAPKTPEVYLRKQSDDGNVAGFVFTITGNGETYHKITDENGFIDLSDLPQYIPGTQQLIEYHVEEEIPVEYIHDKDNASKNFVLEPGKPVYLDFMNKRKMWRLSFKKHDSNLATQAQGKGSLAGAEFALYKDGQFLESYVTDENGAITTDYFPCGPGYTLSEMTPPDGYRVDSTVYAVGLMPGETLEQFNDCNRLEPLDGDDPEVIRRAYSIQSALEYKSSSNAYNNIN